MGLDEWIVRWGEALAAIEGKHPTTVAAYRQSAKRWLREAEVASLEGLTRETFERYIKRLHYSGLGPASIRSAVAGARSWCRYLVLHGALERDPTLGLQTPKVYRRTRKVLSLSEVRRLVLGEGGATLPRHPEEMIAQVMFAVAYGAALRASEIGRLLTEDVEWHEDGSVFTVMIRHAKHATGDQVIPIGRQISRLLGAYLQLRPQLGTGKYLFPGKQNRPMSPDIVRRKFTELCQRVGLQVAGRELTPHLLRRSRCTHLLEAPRANVRVIQQFMRHASVETTMAHYAYTDEARVMRMIASRDPLDTRRERSVRVRGAMAELLAELGQVGPSRAAGALN